MISPVLVLLIHKLELVCAGIASVAVVPLHKKTIDLNRIQICETNSIF